MQQKRMFSEFICSQYQAELMEAIQDYSLENPDIFRLRVVEDVSSVECENISSKKVFIRNLPGLELEFDLVLEAELNISEYSHRQQEEESVTQWFLVKGSVNLGDSKSGINIYDVSEYEPKYSAESDYTDSLSPCVFEKQTEDKAESFLSEFCPEALQKPTFIDVKAIAEKMGLIIVQRNLSSDGSIFGQIIFEKCRTEVISDKTNQPYEEEFESGTIIVDPTVFFLRNFGSIRHTVVHECVHWYLHRKTFLLAKCLKQACHGFKCCITGEMPSKEQTNDAWFLEWQANKIASMILVPKKTLIPKAKDLLISARKNNPETADIYLIEKVIRDVADYYGVSFQVAKIRLSECGFPNVDGVSDYCDGRYLKPYAYKKESLLKHESYSVCCKDLIIETMRNPELGSLLKSNQLVYTDAHLVVNDAKYIMKTEKGRELTEYGRLNLDECAVKFLIDSDKKRSENGFYRECILFRGFNGDLKTFCVFEKESNKDNIAKAKAVIAQQQRENEFLDLIKPYRFAETLNNLIEKTGFTIELLAERSGIEERQIYRYKNGKVKNPTIETMIALAIGLDLPYRISILFLETASCSLRLVDERHALYNFFLMDGCDMDIDKCNKMLIENHLKPLVQGNE